MSRRCLMLWISCLMSLSAWSQGTTPIKLVVPKRQRMAPPFCLGPAASWPQTWP